MSQDFQQAKILVQNIFSRFSKNFKEKIELYIDDNNPYISYKIHFSSDYSREYLIPGRNLDQILGLDTVNLIPLFEHTTSSSIEKQITLFQFLHELSQLKFLTLKIDPVKFSLFKTILPNKNLKIDITFTIRESLNFKDLINVEHNFFTDNINPDNKLTLSLQPSKESTFTSFSLTPNYDIPYYTKISDHISDTLYSFSKDVFSFFC